MGVVQELVFPLAGNTNWDGQAITRMRFDLQTDAVPRVFAIDSITVPKESYRLKGLRFRNPNTYTISGDGYLRIDPDAGNGAIDVQLGIHVIDLPLTLTTNTDFSLATNTTLNVSESISGSGGLTKLGDGGLTFTGTNIYTGNTVVSNGILALSASMGATSLISNSPVITVTAGANLDVSGIVSGFQLANGQTLKGNGSVTGAVTVASGSALSPGNSIGTITLNNSPIFQGTLLMEINKTNAPITSDQLIIVAKPLTNGGVLVVTNVGPALTGGEVFTLFSATSYSGNFTTTNLPPLPTTNLNWWLGNLAVNGSLVVNRAPAVTNANYFRAKGTSLKISITNLLTNFTGDADGNTVILQSLGASAQGAVIITNATHILYTPSSGVASNANDSFSYTVNDGRGGVRQASININVVNATSLLSISNSFGAGLAVNFNGIFGYDYVLQRSSNLVQWSNVMTNTLPWSGNTTGLLWFTDSPPHNPAFYRATLP